MTSTSFPNSEENSSLQNDLILHTIMNYTSLEERLYTFSHVNKQWYTAVQNSTIDEKCSLEKIIRIFQLIYLPNLSDKPKIFVHDLKECLKWIETCDFKEIKFKVKGEKISALSATIILRDCCILQVMPSRFNPLPFHRKEKIVHYLMQILHQERHDYTLPHAFNADLSYAMNPSSLYCNYNKLPDNLAYANDVIDYVYDRAHSIHNTNLPYLPSVVFFCICSCLFDEKCSNEMMKKIITSMRNMDIIEKEGITLLSWRSFLQFAHFFYAIENSNQDRFVDIIKKFLTQAYFLNPFMANEIINSLCINWVQPTYEIADTTLKKALQQRFHINHDIDIHQKARLDNVASCFPSLSYQDDRLRTILSSNYTTIDNIMWLRSHIDVSKITETIKLSPLPSNMYITIGSLMSTHRIKDQNFIKTMIATTPPEEWLFLSSSFMFTWTYPIHKKLMPFTQAIEDTPHVKKQCLKYLKEQLSRKPSFMHTSTTLLLTILSCEEISDNTMRTLLTPLLQEEGKELCHYLLLFAPTCFLLKIVHCFESTDSFFKKNEFHQMLKKVIQYRSCNPYFTLEFHHYVAEQRDYLRHYFRSCPITTHEIKVPKLKRFIDTICDDFLSTMTAYPPSAIKQETYSALSKDMLLSKSFNIGPVEK